MVLAPPQVRKKVNTLLIIDVHARDIVSDFVRESVLNAKEFAWESQVRDIGTLSLQTSCIICSAPLFHCPHHPCLDHAAHRRSRPCMTYVC
jgi:hypothetical protein